MRRELARRVAVVCSLILLACLLAAPSVKAQIWNGTTNDLWTTGSNWSSSPNPPLSDGSADLIFGNSSNYGPVADTMPWSIRSLTISNTDSNFYTITGNQLTIGTGGIANNGKAAFINNDIVVGASQTWSANTGNLTFGDPIAPNTITLTNTLTVSTTLASSVTINDDIMGSQGIIKTGVGNLFLKGTDSYSGGTTISAGAIRGSTDSLQGNISVATGASLVFDQTASSISSGTFNGTVSGSGSLINFSGTTILGMANPNFTGTVTVSGGTLESGASGALPGDVAYTLSGTGTLNLGSSDLQISSLSGVAGTTIELNTQTLTVNNTDNSSFAGVIQGNGSLIKANTGTLTLTGANTYTGGTTVSQGTLQGDTNGLQGNINVATDANVNFNQSVDGTYGSNGILSGAGTVSVTGTANVTFSGANTYSGGTTISGGTLVLGGTAGTAGTGAITDNTQLTFARTDGTPVTVANTIQGTGGVQQNGPATIILTGTNTYTGATTINSATTLQVGDGTTTGTLGTGDVTNSGALVFNPAAATPLTVSNAIHGAGTVEASGTGTTSMTGTSDYTGPTTIDSGATLQVGNGGAGGTLGTSAVTVTGTLDLNRSDDFTFSNATSGTGTLDQIGTGIATVNGVVSVGNTLVDSGQLNVDGNTFTSPVTVNAAGTLGGVGTIIGTVDNQGNVAAGNAAQPMGTLHETGNFTNENTGNVTVNVGGSGVNSVLAVAGTATLNGGTVLVTSATGSGNAGQKYTFLTATGGVNGIFDSVSTDNLPGFLEAVLGYTDDTAFVTLLRNGESYAAVGNTFNERAVGRYLDQVSPNASGDLQTVFDTLNSIDDDQLRIAESQMSGSIHGTLGQIGVQNTSLILGQVAQRLRSASFTPNVDPCCSQCSEGPKCGCSPNVASEYIEGNLFAPINSCGSHWTGWAQGFGLGGNARSDGNAGAVTYDMGGVVAGVERWLDDTRLLGFWGGYVGSGIANATEPNNVINGGNFGAYLYADDGFNYYTVMSGFEFDSYTTHRLLDFGDIDRTASANYNGWQAYSYLERGVSYESNGRVFQPFGALQYIYLRQNNFDETGAGAIDLAANGVNTNSLRSLLGARMQWAWLHRTGRRSMPEIHAYWMHEYLDSHTIIDATFSPTPVGGSTPFIAHGLDLGRNWAVAGAGFAWELPAGWSMFVNSDIQTNNEATLYIGSGGLGHIW